MVTITDILESINCWESSKNCSVLIREPFTCSPYTTLAIGHHWNKCQSVPQFLTESIKYQKLRIHRFLFKPIIVITQPQYNSIAKSIIVFTINSSHFTYLTFCPANKGTSFDLVHCSLLTLYCLELIVLTTLISKASRKLVRRGSIYDVSRMVGHMSKNCRSGCILEIGRISDI